MTALTGRALQGPVVVRAVGPADAPAMAALINPIIVKGGTTAYEDPLDAAYFEARIEALAPPFSAHVAEAGGRFVGFQFCEPHSDLPPDMGDIATFAALDAPRGVGRALFAATRAAAEAGGLRALFAYIRADNEGGLAYYEKMGLRTERIDEAVPLKDGTPVDRVGKVLIL